MPDGVAAVLESRRTAPMGDHGTVINIVSWLLLVVSMSTLTARFVMKLSINDKRKRFGLDDLFIALAAIFSIGHTIVVSIEAIQAIGQPFAELNSNQQAIFQKAEYASCMLYIASLGCARISLCLLIKKLLPGSTASSTVLVFACFTGLWTFSGIFVTAFPCSVPKPWEFLSGKNCIDIIKWVNYVGITNIVIEILLVSIPLCVWNLRTSPGRRVSVSCIFLARLSLVAAVGTQLYFFNRDVSDFQEYWRTVLCVQIIQHLSIITACLPCLHPFVIDILAGSINVEAFRYSCPTKQKALDYIFKIMGMERKGDKLGKFDAMVSESSCLEITDDKQYCRPLATYGLDRSSAHLHSQHFNRFPSSIALPLASSEAPPDIFMSPVQIPRSRPTTSHSAKTSISSAPPIPQTLHEVGVLPTIDWETDSNSDRESAKSSTSRNRTSEYVFNRSKVISVPEESHLKEQEGQYYKKYYPPPPTPGLSKNPPRSF